METFNELKKYFVSGSLLVAVVILFVCFGAGAVSTNGNIYYSVFELIFSDKNVGSLVGFIALVLGIVLNAVICAFSWLKKDGKKLEILSLVDSAFYFVSGIFFAMVETFSTKGIYVSSVFACVMALCCMAIMIACGANLLMTKVEDDSSNKKYKYKR